MMKTYKTIQDKVVVGEKARQKGYTFQGNPNSANVRAKVRFKEIEEVKAVAEGDGNSEGKSDGGKPGKAAGPPKQNGK